jgi:hypothetical protein
MKRRFAIFNQFVVLAAFWLSANAQTPAPELKHFGKSGLSFDCPADVKLEDRTGSATQHLVLTHAQNGAQIMVMSRYEMIDSPEQLAKARKDVFDFFVDSMVKEFERQKAQVERAERHIEIAGSEASGVRLRAVLEGEPGNAEIYSLVLGRRLVMVSFIGSDKELDAAAAAWAIVRRSLKVEPRTTDLNVSAPAEVAASGTLTGSTYENRYFGLTLTVPAGWQVQDSSFKQQARERGKELVTSDDPAKRAEIIRAADNTLSLLMISEYPVGGSVPFNPMIVCGAEKVPSSMVKDTDYISALKQTLQFSRVTMSVVKDVYSQTLGGVEFSVIDLALDIQGATVNQSYYAHIMKGYALFFIVVYQTNEQLNAESEILRSVVLR